MLEPLEPRRLLSLSHPTADFLLESADLYARSGNAADLGQPLVPLYTDYNAGGTYGSIDAAYQVILDGNAPDAARGLSSFRADWTGAAPHGYFQFGLGTTVPNRPRDIADFGEAQAVRFFAKGDLSGEAKLRVFRVSSTGGWQFLAERTLALTTAWQEFAYDLQALGWPAGLGPRGLHAVQFVLGEGSNPVHSLWVDELRVNTDGFDPLRLVQSYRQQSWADSEREVTVYPNRSFLYDNALAIQALLLEESSAARQTALEITDAILATALPNGSYYNDRSGGHALLGSGSPRSAWSQKQTLGDNAWFALASLEAYQATGQAKYLTAARGISDWAETLKDAGNLKGYRGGFNDSGVAFPWRATEHNIDLYAVNRQVAEVLTRLGDAAAAEYQSRAAHAADFVLEMFDDSDGKFWTGTYGNDDINRESVPLDAQLWAILTLAQSEAYATAIDWSRPLQWAEAHLQDCDGVYCGFTFSDRTTPDRVWFEGTAQAAVAYRVIGDPLNYERLIGCLDRARTDHPYADGRGVVAASGDNVTDVFLGAVYDARLHAGATAWTYLAHRGVNPFQSPWTTPTTSPRIVDDGEVGFATLAGAWTSSSGGYLGDRHYAVAGTGTSVSRWTFAVQPGQYRVSATWQAASNRAGNAPFSILTGTLGGVLTPLGTVSINQRSAPNDFTAAGTNWEYLGEFFTVTGDGLAVDLSNAANGVVIADAIRIERIGPLPAPIQRLDDGDSGYTTVGAWSASSGGYQADKRYATAGTGSSVSRWTFTVNPGRYRIAATWQHGINRATNAPYNILAGTTYRGVVPLGSVTTNQRLAPNDLADDGVNWEQLGDVFGVSGNALAVELSNAADGVVIADGIRIERVGDLPQPLQIVDDGEAGFSTAGSWVPSAGGYRGDKNYSLKGSGADKARWTFSVEPGQFRVSATWQAATNRATDAPFRLLVGTDGGGLAELSTTSLNQQLTPNDLTDSGAVWEDLGGIYTLTVNTLVVELTDAANGIVIADAMRVERVAGLPDPVQITDNGDAGHSLIGVWTAAAGGYLGDKHYATAGSGSRISRWTFNLEPGQYRVSATWEASANRATNAPYRILAGTTLLNALPVNQRLVPNDFTDRGAAWEDLGGPYTVTGSPLVVELSDLGNGVVVADAIRIERLV